MTGERKPEKDDADRPDWSAVALLSTIGLTLALSVGIGIGLGLVIDGWLKTKGLAVIIGAILGVAAGFREMVTVVRRANRRELERRRDGENEP
jgi:ATP synthase protein I